MQISEAVNLIKHEKLSFNNPQVWADLGCGSGTFTLALAELLPNESLIYAIDANENILTQISEEYSNVNIKRIKADFTEFDLPVSDGILMGNSLHFIAEKEILLNRLKLISSKFLIVEYETDVPNPFVPYPIRFESLKKLFEGYKTSKISERDSIYNTGKIYSVIFEKN